MNTAPFAETASSQAPSHSASSPRAATLSLAAAALFVLLLGAMHAFRPDLDPSRRFISEYALGAHGWLMNTAFAALFAACVLLWIAIRAQLSSWPGRVGALCLLAGGAGSLLAALFEMDPAGTAAPSTAGKLHELGAMLGGFLLLASIFVAWALGRHPAWRPARPALWIAALAAWAAEVALVVALMGAMSADGQSLDPDAPIGWPNRLLVLGYSVWIATVAWHARRIARGGGR